MSTDILDKEAWIEWGIRQGWVKERYDIKVGETEPFVRVLFVMKEGPPA